MGRDGEGTKWLFWAQMALAYKANSWRYCCRLIGNLPTVERTFIFLPVYKDDPSFLSLSPSPYFNQWTGQWANQIQIKYTNHAIKISTADVKYRYPVLKSNSWTYNFVEVSGLDLESSHIWGFHTQCLHYKPVSNHFCSGGGGGGTINSKEENN